MTAIDFAGINSAALRNGRSLVQDLIPGGKFRSLEYIVKNPCRNDERPGSFTINYRDGVWKDFATADGGSDLVSLIAYLRGVNQGDAARELAERLGVPLTKSNGVQASSLSNARIDGHGVNGNGAAVSADAKVEVFPFGDDGPPQRANEIRRHVYSSEGFTLRIKIKKQDGSFVNLYRIFADGAPIGWQAKKPDSYVAIPYVSAAIDPFDPELMADEILWPEGEKDVDSLNRINLPAFTFGGVGDGLPEGIGQHLKDRRLVILADNDEPGRAHAEKKAAVAHAAGAASIKIMQFPELPAKGDISDFIANGGTAEQLNARIDGAALWSPSQEITQAGAARSTGKTSELVSFSTIKPEATDWLWHHRNSPRCANHQHGMAGRR